MSKENHTVEMLDLMVQPVFYVQDHLIVRVNQAAEGLLITPGMDIREMLLTGSEEYESFRNGSLYLTLSIWGEPRNASVTRMDENDIVILEEEADQAEFRAMGLAARELRKPLNNVMLTANELFPLILPEDDPEARKIAAQMNRGLYQMLRILGNMSYAESYNTGTDCLMEMIDITAFMDEVFEKNQGQAEHLNISQRFSNLKAPVFTLADRDALERAVLNILGNAMKFTPAGGTIEASLTQSGQLLRLTVLDSGEGIDEKVRGTIFQRHRRQSTLEDPRYGLGLGMVIIHGAAAMHGGTVLLDQVEGKGARITMTIQIQKNSETMVHSTIQAPVGLSLDYASGWDRSLIELSECLPDYLYAFNTHE